MTGANKAIFYEREYHHLTDVVKAQNAQIARFTVRQKNDWLSYNRLSKVFDRVLFFAIISGALNCGILIAYLIGQ